MWLWAVLYRWNKRHWLTLKKFPSNVGRQLKRHMKLFKLWLFGLQEHKTHSELLEWRTVFIIRKQSSHRTKGHEIKCSQVSREMQRNRSTWLLALFLSLGPRALLCFASRQLHFPFSAEQLPLLLINLQTVAITFNLQDFLTTNCQQSYASYQVLKIKSVQPPSSLGTRSHKVRFVGN